jgi:23S rRNA (cytosine1962-C5)-methyltransferase
LDTGPKAAFRAVFSEADGLSGLVVDRFADFAIAQFTALGPARREAWLGPLIQNVLGVRGVLRRTEKGIGQLEGLPLEDGPLCGEEPPAEVIIEEHGLQWAVDLRTGQKTGYYLDQRENRRVVAGYTRGRRVLDAFCYAGGFGVYARQAGAALVESVDASEAALQLAARNAELNQLEGIVRVKADVFGYLDAQIAAGRVFDVVILDPPKFARNRAALPAAIAGYRRLHQQALRLLSEGGILVSCCCTGLITPTDLEDLIAQTAADQRRELRLLERRGPAPDHPISYACREGAYLKCFISYVSPPR